MDDELSALLDDPDFGEIRERMSRFNLFEALGAVDRELGHSNFLGYLLAPKRPHGLGSRPLELILRRALETMPAEVRPVSTLELIVTDLDEAIVHRERFAIDLLIEISALRLVVVIENKIHAKAGKGQLQRYRERIESEYPDSRKLFLFLTPDGLVPDDNAYWPLGYAAVADTLATLSAGLAAGDATRLIVEHYVDMLRKNIVEDDHLRALAGRLYERHKEALEFIFKSRPSIGNLVEVVAQRVRSVEGLVVDSENASVLRFVPSQWESTLTYKANPAEWSRTGRGLMFEVKRDSSRPGRLLLSLILGPGDPVYRKALYEAAKARPEIFTGRSKSMGEKWSTLFSRDLMTARLAETLTVEQQEFNVGLAWSDFQGGSLMPLIPAVLEIDAEVSASLGGVQDGDPQSA